MDKSELLNQIAQEIELAGTSPLYAYRREQKLKSVPGHGNPDAKIMFIGEAPGLYEAQQGKPFVGESGKLLDELLAHVGLSREAVFITNVINDRPPDNRDPRKNEIAFYSPFLDRQLNIIRPPIIVTLGRFAMAQIFEKFGIQPSDSEMTIGQVHGRVFEVTAWYGQVRVIPQYHPAAALYDEDRKSVV